MSAEPVTACPHCRRETPTIGGLCPNCGLAKDGAGLWREVDENPRNGFWDDLDVVLLADVEDRNSHREAALTTVMRGEGGPSFRAKACAAAAVVSLGLALPSGSASAAVTARPLAPADVGFVSAYRGSIAWATDGMLHVREHGKVRNLQVPTGRAAADIDLGPGPDGRTVAVYSQCRGKPTFAGYGNGMLPTYVGQPACDLYLYDPRRHKQRRLAALSTAAASEFEPTIWRDRIAFVRRYTRRRGRAGWLPHIFMARLDGSGLREIRGGSPGYDEGFQIHEAGDVTGMDLRGTRLAFGWSFLDKTPPCPYGGSGVAVVAGEMWLLTGASRRPRLVERGCTKNPDVADGVLISPSLTATALRYLRYYGQPSLGVFNIAAGRARYAPLLWPANPAAAAYDGARWIVNDRGRLRVVHGLRFASSRPELAPH